jgi:predicted amidohydrolase YtcJ
MGITEPVATVYRQLAAAGRMPIRVYGFYVASQAEAALQRKPEIGSYFTLRGIKLFADGALGSRGAALLEPYTDEPGNSGLLQISQAELARLARLAVGSGWQLTTHAIGDRAVRMVLDAYESALSSAPAGADLRFRIEHAQMVAEPDRHRFAKLSVLASMQPTHATSDMPWAEKRIGAHRLQGAYAWRILLQAGARIAFGSDFPVEQVSPLLGLAAAVTRQDAAGRPSGGWMPEQRLTVQEALRAFLSEAAYFAFQEDERGSIQEGMLADFTVLDRDSLDAPEHLRSARVAMTIVSGKIVFERTAK